MKKELKRQITAQKKDKNRHVVSRYNTKTSVSSVVFWRPLTIQEIISIFETAELSDMEILYFTLTEIFGFPKHYLSTLLKSMGNSTVTIKKKVGCSHTTIKKKVESAKQKLQNTFRDYYDNFKKKHSETEKVTIKTDKEEIDEMFKDYSGNANSYWES